VRKFFIEAAHLSSLSHENTLIAPMCDLLLLIETKPLIAKRALLLNSYPTSAVDDPDFFEQSLESGMYFASEIECHVFLL
jgi:hypothetical protein